ncbi:unnamed protein product [Gongylonema pulchrum]|uniref:Diguanylate cyclase n=1 Tax=Gongylonema pulchrum TaxID=637853 RepID=A0A183EZT6_9BILA|nr:unnamed protein product [Gongylonema pulchrum]
MNAEKHPLYRPIEMAGKSQIFQGLTIALSTLPAAEKEIYTDMLVKLGAQYVSFHS